MLRQKKKKKALANLQKKGRSNIPFPLSKQTRTNSKPPCEDMESKKKRKRKKKKEKKEKILLDKFYKSGVTHSRYTYTGRHVT